MELEVAIILGLPFVLSLIALLTIRRSRSARLDTPMDFGEAWLRLVSTEVTPRQALRFLAALFPFAFIGSFGIFPEELLVVVVLAVVVLKIAKWQSAMPDRTIAAVDQLQQIVDNLAQTRLHLEHLAQTVRQKQHEIQQKEELSKELDKTISEREKRSEAFLSLTEQQRDLLATAVKRSQRKGVFSSTVVVIGSIALNIVATIIWSLLGNPGQSEMIDHAKQVTKLWPW